MSRRPLTTRLFAPVIYLASLVVAWRGRRDIKRLEQRALPPQAQIAGHQVGRPRWMDWSDKATIRKGYEESETAFICMNKNSTAVASVPWFIEREAAPGQWERDTAHPANRLLAKPNPEWSWGHLVKLMSMHSYGDGNVLLDITRNDVGEPVELWTIRPEITKPIPAGPGEPRMVREYEVTPEGRGPIYIPADDVVHLQEIPNPNDPYWGLSRLRAGGYSVEIEISARSFQKHSLDNYGTMSMLVTPAQDQDPGAPELSKEDAKAEREGFEAMFKGPKNARKVAWSSGRVEVHDMAKTPKELDFNGGRDYVRESICSLFDTPPPVIGILSRATYNNSRTVREIWWESGIIPQLSFLRDGLNHGFVAKEWPEDKIRLNYDLSRVPALAHRFDEAIARVKALLEIGWSQEEAEARVDLGRPRLGNNNTRERSRHLRVA